MNASEWIFILAGIAGLLVLVAIGARHVRGVRAGDLRGAEEWEEDVEAAIGGHEVRAVVRPEAVAEILRRVNAIGARDVAVVPLDAIHHLPDTPARRGRKGALRVEVVVDDEQHAWDVADAMREIGGTSPPRVGRVWIHNVSDVLPPEPETVLPPPPTAPPVP